MLRGMSVPTRRTSSAFGEKTRKITRLSGRTSGDTNAGAAEPDPLPAWPGGGAEPGSGATAPMSNVRIPVIAARHMAHSFQVDPIQRNCARGTGPGVVFFLD